MLTVNVSKIKKSALPNITFILNVFSENEIIFVYRSLFFKDTWRENPPSNKTKALTKSIDTDI